MFGGYQWDGIDFNKINFGADQPVVMNYGGQDTAVPLQNFDGHDTQNGHGAIGQLLDLKSDGFHQNFGSADESMDFDIPVQNDAAAEKADRLKFEQLLEVLSDLYSFENALQAVPAMKAYFGIVAPADETTSPPFDKVKNFLNPTSLGKNQDGGLVLGLPALTLENPPKSVDENNRHLVITPAILMDAFCAKDIFERAERYHVRQNIMVCLTALAELQRHQNDPSKIDTRALILQVQQCRLKSSVDYEYGREAGSAVLDASDKAAHVKELTRRTLARLQQGVHLAYATPDFESLGLQSPGNAKTLILVNDLAVAGDAKYSGKLARLTLDQMADLVVEISPDWRLPMKTAIADAVADYLGVVMRDVTPAEINQTRGALLDWANGRRRVPPDIKLVLACIPSICRETVLQMDPLTKEVKEHPLKYAQDLFLPSAVAKAIKACSSSLESPVAVFIKNRKFYEEIYIAGKTLSTSLNLHGMYLQCSNPGNNNLAFQTPAQFNHRVYATRCSSGLYVNVTDRDNPQLECRENAGLRLNYIDKLWSLFRVIVMDEVGKNLALKLPENQAFMSESDPEKRRNIASDILDRCVVQTFGDAAGNLTGITRNILVNAAIDAAELEPDRVTL
jgi:hypothetical protein